MRANYHTHTPRCRHAVGSEREYIEQAIEAGMEILGFSDHTPYPFPDGHDSGWRMFLHQADDYFQTLTDLKKEYAGQIELHIGVEAEYYPSCFAAMVENLRQYPCEYMILGQHFLENEDTGEYTGRRMSRPDQLTRYVDQVLAGLSTGLFLYLAHPDLLHWTGDPALYRQEMKRLCQEVKFMGYPLEINFLGLYDHRNYPCEAFWQIAGEVGNTVIFGVDAHEPEALNRPEVEAQAKALAEKYRLHAAETLVPPFRGLREAVGVVSSLQLYR